MLHTNLDHFKTRQEELYRQAAKYHLVRAQVNQPVWLSKVIHALGQMMIESGHYLLNQIQGVQ